MVDAGSHSEKQGIRPARATASVWAADVQVFLCGFVLLILLGAAGCTTPPQGPGWERTGDPVEDGYRAIRNEPVRDRVLWQYRTALAAMRAGRDAEAAVLFDDAFRVAGSVQTGSEARKSRRLFGAESDKPFIGEAHERAMAYFYRGILYWKAGEADNARACFRNGQFIDGEAGDERGGDYVLLEFLDGLATERLGGDGSDRYARAVALNEGRPLPEYEGTGNVLVFLEWGEGPRKVAAGAYGEELRYRAGRTTARTVRVAGGGGEVVVEPWDDVTFQAMTRGRRQMDRILAGQAVAKGTTDTLGDAALMSGAILATDRDTQAVGAGLVAAGVLSKIAAAAMTPGADTRTWETLPQYLSFATLDLPPGPVAFEVEYRDAGGAVVASRRFEGSVLDGARTTVFFISDRNTT